MNVFQTHADIVGDYSSYIRSFISIADPEIRKVVNRELSRGKLWPEPLLQFNPAFEMFGSGSGYVSSATGALGTTGQGNKGGDGIQSGSYTCQSTLHQDFFH